MSEKTPSLSQRYTDISGTLAAVSETVTRIDERVEIFMAKIKGVEEDLGHHVETCPARCGLTDLVTKIAVIESKNGKVLREELLQHVQDNKQAIQALASQVDGIERTLLTVQTSTNQQAGRWKWIGLFIFNALFNIVALVAAAALLHYWKMQMVP